MLEGCELLPQSQSQADTHAWCQDLSINAAESVYLSGKIRSNLVRRARLVTYVSLTVTLVGGFSGIAAALALDRCSHHSPCLLLGYSIPSLSSNNGHEQQMMT